MRSPNGCNWRWNRAPSASYIPSENKRDVADVPDAVLTAIQWQFYDSPTRAAILALGLG